MKRAACMIAVILLCGCAAHKPIAGTHLGPMHRDCFANGDAFGPSTTCENVQDTLTDKGNRQVLAPLGCALKKAHILQVFWIGIPKDEKPVCISEIKKENRK